MKFLMNQSVSSNPPFFLRLLSPFVCSCGPIKGSRIGFAKFFRRNTTPYGCGDFPETPWSLKLCHSNLRFTFATGTIKHQARGDKSGVFGKRIRTFRLLPFPLLHQGELIIRLIGMFVKATRTERMRIRNRLSPPAILNALAVSSLQVRTTVFSCPLTVGRVLKPYQCLAHRQGYKTYPTTLTLFDGRVCFSVLGDDV